MWRQGPSTSTTPRHPSTDGAKRRSFPEPIARSKVMTRPLQFFQYQNGVLSSDGVSLEAIAEQVGTPVYIYSASGFIDPLKELQEGMRDLNHLICFALKSNSNLSILRMLAREGAGMDLVSGGELFRAAQAGVQSDKIVFSGVGKTADEMKQGLLYEGTGIYSFNVESLPELRQLNDVAISLGKRAPVALRFNPDVDAKTHPYISTGLKRNKFGITRSEVLSVVRSLDQLRGIHLKGLSIHIGSQLLSLAPLDDAFSKLSELVHELDHHQNRPLEFADLGGGIGITYKNEKAPLIQNYCKLIKKHFGKRAKNSPQFKLLIEPGRTLSGNAGVLVSKVIYRKERLNKDFLVIDAAMNDLIRPALYESFHEIVPLEKRLAVSKSSPKKKWVKTNIVGPVCESSDCFASDRPFSSQIGPGDLVAILSAGAYGFSMSSTYNSRPRPAEVLIQEGKFRTIRTRETWEDLVRGE